MLQNRCLNAAYIAPCLLLVVLGSSNLLAAPPTIDRLSVLGLQSGGTAKVSIEGKNLGPDSQVFMPDVPIVRQEVNAGATRDRIELELSLDSLASPGIYDLRIFTSHGVSNPLPIAVDAMPQLTWRENVETTPVALSGNVRGNQTLSTKFPAKKSQAVVIEIEAQRIGSQLRPVLHVYDERKVQVAWASASTALGDDARILFQPPADGVYSVEIHDSRYAAPPEAHFRLKLGAFEYADTVYPAAVQTGMKQVLRFASSNLPAGTAAEFTAPSIATRIAASWPVRPLLSGPRPLLMATNEPQTVEAATTEVSNDPQKLQSLPLPGGLTGRLSMPKEVDRYRISARPGTKLRLSLAAQRLNSPLDGVLSVVDSKGAELATADDGNRTTDPSLDFVFPKNAKSVTAVVKDVLRRGGPDFVYHLSAKPSDAPDFSLSFDSNRLQVPVKGNALLKVQVRRTSFDGPIRLRLIGLPPGVLVSHAEVPEGSDVGFCLLTGVGAQASVGLVNVVGEGENELGPIIRQAVGPASGASASCPWLRYDLAVALISKPSPISIDLAEIADAPTGRLPLGGKTELAVDVRRASEVKGNIRLSLVTTQRSASNRQGRNGMPSPDRDDLRLANSQAADGEGLQKAAVVVPADLPLGSYGVVVRADLLAGDSKSVVASAFTRPRWMDAVVPFSAKLEKAAIDVRAGEGETGELVGSVVRTDGFTGPITLTIDGLPQGIINPKFEVPAAECDFRFPVSLPFGVKAGEIKARLEIQGKGSDVKSSALIAAKPIELKLNVVPGDKPKAEKPLAIFEDEQEFADQLTEGEGIVALSDQEIYTGNYSLLLKKKPKSRASIPGLEIKIRENPGPGEYRYLRFAWKGVGKVNRIGLQLIDDSHSGGNASKAEKYTYYSGAGFSPAEKTIVVDDKFSSQWTLVTRDVFADFGEMTITGLGVIYLDGKSVQYDHIYVGRTVADLDNVDVKK